MCDFKLLLRFGVKPRGREAFLGERLCLHLFLAGFEFLHLLHGSSAMVE